MPGVATNSTFAQLFRQYKKSLLTLLLFIAYAVLVFWSNFESLQRLQENSLTQFQLETEKQASAISYFFSERRNDISELVESDAIGGFFTNRDLGMTYEYGLGVNVQVIEDRFEKLLKRKQVGEQPIYAGFALIDTSGMLIAHWELPETFESFRVWLDPLNHETRVRLASHKSELLVSAPVWINQVYRGELLAWVRADASFAQFGLPPRVGKRLLVDMETGVPLKSGEDRSHWSGSYWKALAESSGSQNGNSVIVQERGEELALSKVNIAQTPLSFVTITPEHAAASGTERLFVLAAAVIPLIVVLLAFLDVLERRRLEELREKARIEAERLAQARSEFLANMSHEIRTPMNAIIGMTELCLATNLNPKQHNYLSKIQRASDSLLRIVNDILDFSKIESGKLEIEQLPFELDRVLDTFGELLTEKAGKKSIELIFDVDDSCKQTFIGDPLRLEQILLNLCGNAIKFSERGNVIVRVRSEPIDAALAKVRFEVIDEGIGLTESELARLFTAFTQADSTTTRRYGGTGLGLAISKRMVELMMGSIHVDSVPGKGSNFSFVVYLGIDARAESHARNMERQLLPYALRPVLVVDDNPCCRAAIAAQLRQLGLKCEGRGSGAEALEAVSRPDAPDYLAVLVDYRMPVCDGIETIHRLRNHWNGRGMPPIILTSINSHDKELEPVSSLFDSLMVKPTSASRLFAEISPFLGFRSGASMVPTAGGEAGRGELSGIEVLLVDDVPLNQEVVRDMLESAGVRVRVVNNGQEALDSIAGKVPDCVMMDCQMPIMDGYEATRRLRADERYRRLPIIALTANAMHTERDRCREAGMDAYIAKPVRSRELFAVLATHLPRRTISRDASPVPAMLESMPDIPGLDCQLGVRYANGKPALYRKLLRLFLDSHCRDFESGFRGALAAEDWKNATRQAHSLKGAAMMIGAVRLSEHAKRLEEACHARQLDVIATTLGELVLAMKGICQGLSGFTLD